MSNALILVDIQNDFMPTGALPVKEGDHIVSLVNTLQPQFDLVVATQDFHPADHGSFASQHEGKNPGELIQLDGLPQLLWPDHCVQGTQGAQFHDDLDMSRVAKVFPKGTNVNIDSYSGFFDNGHRQATGMGEYLKAQGIEKVYVVGLATDYCVRFTALDAHDLGFDTYVIADACRAVNINPNDERDVLDELRDHGVHVIMSTQI